MKRSQIISLKSNVHSGESFILSMFTWSGNNLYMTHTLNWSLENVNKFKLLNQVFFEVFGTVFLNLEWNPLVYLTSEWTIDYKFNVVKIGIKSEKKSWVNKGVIKLDVDLTWILPTSLSWIPVWLEHSITVIIFIWQFD